MSRLQKTWWVDESTAQKLGLLALKLGYKYGSGGAIGRFLDAIAKGDLVLVPKENWEKLKEGIDVPAAKRLH